MVASQNQAELVQHRLRESPYFELRNLQCDNVDGQLVIRGRVPSFYLKQLAQTAVLSVDGVERIVDEVQVAQTTGS